MPNTELALNLSKIIKRLELIKNFIALEDEEDIIEQVNKLLDLDLNDSVKDILTLLQQKSYQKAFAAIESFINDFQKVLIPYRKGDKWGYCTPDRKIVIGCKYDNAMRFDTDVAIVKLDGKWELINKHGIEITKNSYYSIDSFRGTLAIVELNKKKGCINRNGEEAIPCKYEFLEHFIDGVVNTYDDIFIDKEGTEIDMKHEESGSLDYLDEIEFPNYWDEDIIKSFVTTYIEKYDSDDDQSRPDFKNGEEVSYIDSKGLEVNTKIVEIHWMDGPYWYRTEDGKLHSGPEKLFNLSMKMIVEKEELIRIQKNGKFGYYSNKSDQMPFIPFKYEAGKEFNEGLASVKLDQKWGYIDSKGNEVINFKYDDAHKFIDGLALVKLNGKLGFIDKNGSEVIPCKYESFIEGLPMIENTIEFTDGLALVRLNGKRGFIDKKGVEFWED